ncbi:hypothetical protein EOM86_05680 [Candidatus Nomurabacteria bacterium]|nr:hypothetical protein [Candidatus Nomurabacteria bacterium]
MGTLYYPLDDSEVITNKVRFTATMTGKTEPEGTVQFYTPVNLTIADSATYGSIDLGTMGGAAKNIYDKALKAQESGGFADLGTAASTIMSGISSAASKLWQNKGEIGEYYLLNALPENISRQVSYNAKQVVNPHTMTTFQSINIRSFSFAFKMIAESREEASQILQIDQFFRKNLYPTLSALGLFQIFPPIWQIKFYHGPRGTDKENRFLPRIHDCFLTSYSSSYNEEYSSFHEDGAPFSISAEMQFTETKPYDRDTIIDGPTAPGSD